MINRRAWGCWKLKLLRACLAVSASSPCSCHLSWSLPPLVILSSVPHLNLSLLLENLWSCTARYSWVCSGFSITVFLQNNGTRHFHWALNQSCDLVCHAPKNCFLWHFSSKPAYRNISNTTSGQHQNHLAIIERLANLRCSYYHFWNNEVLRYYMGNGKTVYRLDVFNIVSTPVINLKLFVGKTPFMSLYYFNLTFQ